MPRAKARNPPREKALSKQRLPGGDYLDRQHGQDLREYFFPGLKLCKGEWAGKPMELLDFQFERMVYPLLCRKKPDGRRRYRKALFGLPRKNAKTTLAAAITVYHLILSGEQGGELAYAANDAQQAAIAFNIAKAMIESSEWAPHCKLYRREIHFKGNDSVMRVFSSKASGVHGANLSFALCDELHLWKGRDLWDAILSGCGGRTQSQVVAITTAGNDPESLCREIWNHAELVAKGSVEDPDFLPVLYGLKPDQDWTDEKVWAECNPGLGQTVYLDFLRSEFREAQLLPSKQNSFKQLHLNAWVESAEVWIPIEKWNARKTETPPLDVLQKSTGVIGLDVSEVHDLTACTVTWKLADNKFFTDTHCFIPEATVIAERASLTPWRRWAEKGILTIIPGEVIDYEFIRAHLIKIAEQFGLWEIVTDRHQVAQLAAELNILGFTVTGCGQGFTSMDPATKGWERGVLAGQLSHNGNEVLAYCQANSCVIRDPAGNQKLTKGKKKRKRIDATVAGVMSLDRLRFIAPTGGGWDGSIC